MISRMTAGLIQNPVAAFQRRGNAQEVHREPNFGFSVLLEKWTPTIAIERLEAFLTSIAQEFGATEIWCSRISPVPHDVAEKTACTRGSNSFLARPRK
jgi:hypothetical protein